ncbi:MAG: GntR family transcriptional regulator [Pseudomonadota bacterium]
MQLRARTSEADRRPKVDLVYDELRSAILSGHRAPGEFLDKSELAEEFGVSRQPIASAIDRLAFDGLAKVVPQHGSFVTKLDRTAIFERFFIRRAIEVELVLVAAQSISDDVLAQLSHNIRYQQAALDGEDLSGFFRLDIEFHDLVHSVQPNAEAIRILERTTLILERVRRLLLPVAGRPNKTLNEHIAILDALRKHDSEAAMTAMRTHIVRVENQFREFVDKRPHLFENG